VVEGTSAVLMMPGLMMTMMMPMMMMVVTMIEEAGLHVVKKNM
jgi:hypothetical protein